MRRLLVLVVPLWCACPSPSGTDGGAGGGTSTAGGGAGGSGGSAVGGGSGTGGGGGGDAGPSLSLTDFCNQYPAAACAHFAQCNFYESPTSTTCLAAVTDQLTAYCAMATSGTSVYDGRQAQLCLDELSETPLFCSLGLPACGSLHPATFSTAPTVFADRPNGCAASTCDAGACDQSCSGPTCRPFAVRGAMCSFKRPYISCDPSTSWCDGSDGGTAFCVAYPGPGDDCSTRPCGPAQYCVFGGGGGAFCEPRLDAGVPCFQYDACKDGICRLNGTCGVVATGSPCDDPTDCGAYGSPMVCLGLVHFADGGVSTRGQCGAQPLRGQSCSYEWSSSSSDPCREELAEGCLDGVCRSISAFTDPVGTECVLGLNGHVAAPFFGFATCERGLACLPSTTAHPPHTGRCATALPLGAACKDPLWCVAGLDCLPSGDGGFECRVPPRVGEPCVESLYCRNDAWCEPTADGGICRGRVGADAGCTGAVLCEPGLHCDGARCVANGPSCSYDFQCQVGGVCQGGQCVAMCLR